MKLILGDCLSVLATMPENSVDSIVTDPPYGLSAAKNSGKTSKGGFMGKKWDYDVPSVEIWRECLRVLKPGGHLLSFAGTRTQHRMALRIEDAGFEIRDMIAWLYGSGFPKSHDVSKAIDKAAGAEREVVGVNPNKRPNSQLDYSLDGKGRNFQINVQPITAPSTEDAIKWQGWGTALKPALEPITVARKPLSESTVAKNVLKWGTGGINIDGSRVGMREATTFTVPDITGDAFNSDVSQRGRLTISAPAQGRFPANLILDEEASAMLDAQSGVLTSGKFNQSSKKAVNTIYGKHDAYKDPKQYEQSKGGASRFFYCAKASKSERQGSSHPTMKPIKLMRYLCRLVTPPSGTILDPFMGSGSTGIAAIKEGFRFVGIEREQDYLTIAEARIASALEETE